tara:strand:+ start:304 stop:519 length:216 start_codon:yes stop_codon:yes gene_type:complete
MRYEEKAALQDSNKARMYEEKKKQDKLKKYDVNITFLATVQAEDENEAEDEAINLFDWGNVNIKIEEVSDE